MAQAFQTSLAQVGDLFLGSGSDSSSNGGGASSGGAGAPPADGASLLQARLAGDGLDASELFFTYSSGASSSTQSPEVEAWNKTLQVGARAGCRACGLLGALGGLGAGRLRWRNAPPVAGTGALTKPADVCLPPRPAQALQRQLTALSSGQVEKSCSEWIKAVAGDVADACTGLLRCAAGGPPPAGPDTAAALSAGRGPDACL